MSDSPLTTPSRKKKLLIPLLGAVAACVLTAGTIVGVSVSHATTERVCAEATTSAEEAAAAVKGSVDKAAKARALADGAKAYDKHEGAAVLLEDLKSQSASLTQIELSGDCDSRDAANTLQGRSEAATAQVAVLDDASTKLSTDVEAFQAEAKRVTGEKAKAAAAKEAAEKAAAAKKEAASQPQGDTGGGAGPVPAPPAPGGAPEPAPYLPAPAPYVPAPAPFVPAPAPYVPAPAPYVPAPAPAPAPAPGGGWTPPPPGAGGGGGCTETGAGVFCGGNY
ncbi:hypothetical protein ACX80W_14785 [Arthrobacter sp. TMN-37]